jgi:hypothetical protein
MYQEISFSQELNDGNSIGYVKLDILDQDSVYVVINEDFDSAMKVASNDTLTLEAGFADVRIIKQNYRDVLWTVAVDENKFKTLITSLIPVRKSNRLKKESSYPRLYWEANHFILSDPETDLYIDGMYVGREYAVVDTTGSFEVTGVHSSGKTFTTEFNADNEDPFHFHQNYLRPSRTTSWALSVLPGGSQIYKKQYIKGLAFAAVTIGGLAAATIYESKYQDKKNEFFLAEFEYLSATDHETALRLGTKAEEVYSSYVRLSEVRNTLIYGTTLVWLANIVDGFIAPKIGYRNGGLSIDPYLDYDMKNRQPVIGLSTSF